MADLNFKPEDFMNDVLDAVKDPADPFDQLRVEYLSKLIHLLKTDGEMILFITALGEGMNPKDSALSFKALHHIEETIRRIVKVREKDLDMDPEKVFRENILPFLNYEPEGDEKRLAMRRATAIAQLSTGTEFFDYAARISMVRDGAPPPTPEILLTEDYVSDSEKVIQEIMSERK